MSQPSSPSSLRPGFKSSLTLASSFGAALLLSGCGITGTLGTSPLKPALPAAAAVKGVVMGGQQPVAFVNLQLYSVGTSGYGAAATPLGPAFQSTHSGNFDLPAFTCPNGNPPIFLVGTGGTPIGGAPNSNLALMVGIGPCNTSISFISLNELTTVASVYALSGFMSGPTSIGAPASNNQGLLNAFAAINKVVNIATGTVSGPALPAGATLPTTELNALANILQSCVNSSGGSASDSSDGLTNGTACGKLFYNTTTNSAPADTITAALNIAQHPGNNVSSLNSGQATSPAFQPTLDVNTPPSDWTVAITYKGGGLSSPQAVATDATGQVWITNPGNNSVTLLDNSGKALSGVNGITVGSSPYGVAIDQAGNAWVTNSGDNSISELTSTGAAKATFTGNGLSGPAGIAIDGAGNAWVANSGGNTISAFNTSGTPLTNSPYSGGGLNVPVSIAINPK